ncbi:MAG: B12-binding domain-containing radical SAM protein [Gammaproteobacteria bacterium RIFCSPLOWO2_02_FULL_42_9]|nr:MAG: B12-binding domain-containing radical SAM protein [Gammaproteobacteria bacterium RIFCSPLOWO2_02_FULL_42_9]
MIALKKPVDIILLKPGSQKQLYGDLSDFELTAIEPPLWGAVLASYLLEKGYVVELFDAEIESWSYLETAQFIKEMNPTLATIVVSGTNPSASTMNMIGASSILKHLKEIAPEIKTLLCGLHPSALPERTLKEESADFVCQGEGFYTIPDLIDALKAKQDDFLIKGLWYKKDNRIIANASAPLLDNLDILPMPAWNLLPMQKYRAHNWHCFGDITNRTPYAVIYTSFGCPYKCDFCCINALFGKPKIRFRSPKIVIQEIDFLVKNYGIKNIKIIDEMFALKEAHVNHLCDLIIEREYDLNFWVYARVNTVTQTMLQKMKKAGVNWIAYGFESGSKKVLTEATKGYNLDQVESVVKMTYDEGYSIGANFIFGLPEDDESSMRETLELAQKINAEWANFYCAMAYPGSALYEKTPENQLPKNWQGYSQYSYESLPLPTKYLSNDQVLRFRDRAFNEYYKNPNYLKKIKGKFGPAVEQHIREMLKQNLKRKLLGD